MSRCLIPCLLLTSIITCVYAQFYLARPPLKVPPVDRTCLDCLCQATSQCNETLKCHYSNSGKQLCGPYRISQPYWGDSGKPGDHGDDKDFETCVNSMACAEASIRGYMRKYGKDCDSNGEINCNDFVRIHQMGFIGCGSDTIYDTEYWKRYDKCYNGDLSDGDPSLFGEYDYGESGPDV